jgi:hypothetical protein
MVRNTLAAADQVVVLVVLPARFLAASAVRLAERPYRPLLAATGSIQSTLHMAAGVVEVRGELVPRR